MLKKRADQGQLRKSRAISALNKCRVAAWRGQQEESPAAAAAAAALKISQVDARTSF